MRFHRHFKNFHPTTRRAANKTYTTCSTHGYQKNLLPKSVFEHLCYIAKKMRNFVPEKLGFINKGTNFATKETTILWSEALIAPLYTIKNCYYGKGD